MAEVIANKFGKLLGWNSITWHMLGRDIEGISKISYDDNIPIENAYGANKYPVGEEEGNYEAKAGVDLFKEEVLGLLRSLKPNQRIQDISFDVVVEYELQDGTIYKDIIRNVRFKNNGVDVTQGDGKIVTSFELKTSHIDWNAI